MMIMMKSVSDLTLHHHQHNPQPITIVFSSRTPQTTSACARRLCLQRPAHHVIAHQPCRCLLLEALAQSVWTFPWGSSWGGAGHGIAAGNTGGRTNGGAGTHILSAVGCSGRTNGGDVASVWSASTCTHCISRLQSDAPLSSAAAARLRWWWPPPGWWWPPPGGWRPPPGGADTALGLDRNISAASWPYPISRSTLVNTIPPASRPFSFLETTL